MNGRHTLVLAHKLDRAVFYFAECDVRQRRCSGAIYRELQVRQEKTAALRYTSLRKRVVFGKSSNYHELRYSTCLGLVLSIRAFRSID